MATSVVSANFFFAVIGGLVLLLLAIRTPIEEGNLLKRFGEDYREYKAHTGRFFPRI